MTVITTLERIDFIRPAFEGNPHYLYDPSESSPLVDTLANISLAGGSIVILDEAHFITVEEMEEGIRQFVDDPETARSPLRLIVIASSRRPPDPVLDFLVSYCGIYDIIYDCEGAELTTALIRLLKNPATRFDTLGLRLERTEPPEEDEGEAEAAAEGENPHDVMHPSGEVRVELSGEEIQRQTLSIPETDEPIRLNITLKLDVSQTEDS